MPLPASLPHGDWFTQADEESSDGPVKILKGNAQVESSAELVRADYIEFNEDTKEVVAHGHVYFHGFEKNEQIWCEKLEYNSEDQKGKFWDVKGESAPRVVVRKGVLQGHSPYHWEGEWGERVGDRFYLYNGWMTNCKMPNPWWRVKGPKFEIVQYEYAKSWKSWFILRKLPLFYTPYFYRSLQKQPRHSGFLNPNFVPHSQRGIMVGLGYFWAINRSYDLTYRFQDYNTSAFAHHLDFRGRPDARSDFDLILYDVQDQGLASGNGAPPQKFGGLNVTFLGRSDLGNGWNALGQVDYTTSYRFRQYWSQSVNEVIGSEIHSLGFLNKNWSSFTFDVAMSRLENFQTIEVQEPGSTAFTRNAVLLHKLPEADISSRERQIWDNLPLWFSFYSAAGLLYRSEPIFDANNNLVENFQTRQFTPRVNLAPHVTSAFHIGAFSFVPSFGVDETFYGQSQTDTGQALNGQTLYQVVNTSLLRSARDFSLDIIFPSLERVFNKKTIFGDKLKHVIEPRATYRYVTGIGDDYNRFIRYDQTELLSNTNELELSLTNRIYAKRGDNVQEIFTWELMQKRYFDPTFGGALVPGQPNLFEATADLTAYAFLVGPRSSSPIVSVLRAPVLSGNLGTLSFNWQADYDARYHAMVDSYFSVDYHYQKYFITAGNDSVHVDPLLQIAPANQYRFRVGFGDAQHRGWSAAIDGAYDYKLHQLSYAIAQVTYNTDCCGFSAQLRRIHFGLRDENLYEFSFAIANIGSFGSLKKNDRLF